MLLKFKINYIIMELIFNNFNPWWRVQNVPTSLVGKPREVLDPLKKSLSLKQMTLITGLRRVGKTTLIFQLIDWLIREQNISPYNILYHSFDEARLYLENIVNYYQTTVLKQDLLQVDQIYIFLDEIQKLPGWSEQVKILYDMHPNVKITLSGSANLIMKAGSRESLAGRFFEYEINPLDFTEYLIFRNVEIDYSREAVFKQTIAIEFNQFLKTGGFIEALSFDDIQLVRYFKDSILERVTFRDIPEVFSISVPDLLLRLLNILAQRPGLYLDYKNLANDLKFDQRTINNYFDYLEYSFLIQKLYNFSPNLLTSERKLKRAYLANTGFTFSLASAMIFPKIVEQFWVNFLRAKYFYRSPQKDEVDMVLANNKITMPVEIKMRENISKKTAAPLLKFLHKFDQRRGLIISLQDETEISHDNKFIQVFPYWKYWSILDWLEREGIIRV